VVSAGWVVYLPALRPCCAGLECLDYCKSHEDTCCRNGQRVHVVHQ
jgi:hypothetical protein